MSSQLNTIAASLASAFQKSQHLSPTDIQRRQRQLLERLCRHAAAHVPFYRDTNRLAPLFGADGSFSLDRWEEIPVLTRGEAQQNERALMADRIPPEMLPVTDDRTSGSTGTPLRIKRTFLQSMTSQILLERAVGWNKCGPIRRLAIVDVVEDDHQPSREPGAPVIVPAQLDPSAQLDMLAEHQPSHVLVFPNLLEAWIESGRLERLKSVRALFTTGEILRGEIQRLVKTELGLQVVNFYSTTETGPIGIGGPDGRMRVSEETIWLEGNEALAHNPRPTPVIATPFYGYAMPLIRYATGDYIRFSAHRRRESAGLRRLETVLGRERNLFRRRDGARYWPAVHGDVIGDIIPLRGWQLVQESYDDILLKIVTAVSPSEEQLARVRGELGKMVPGFSVSLQLVDAIADDRAHGKRFESCLSLV